MSDSRITTAEQWADALDAEQSGYATAGDMASHAYAQGSICGVPLDTEADDNYSRRLTAADGSMVVRYEESRGYWTAD